MMFALARVAPVPAVVASEFDGGVIVAIVVVVVDVPPAGGFF